MDGDFSPTSSEPGADLQCKQMDLPLWLANRAFHCEVVASSSFFLWICGSRGFPHVPFMAIEMERLWISLFSLKLNCCFFYFLIIVLCIVFDCNKGSNAG